MSSPHHHPLRPDFERPPVVETALGIQFEELTRFQSIHFGLFHEWVRDQYPVFEDHERLLPIVETFPPLPKVPAIQFRRAVGPGRGYYRDAADGCQLLQVQSDRFGFNWRKSNEQTPYPRYEDHSGRCLELFHRFGRFCVEHGLGEITPNVCEVVYVNHISSDPSESLADLFCQVFSGVAWEYSNEWLPRPEAVSFNRTFEIGEQRGRLYAEASIVLPDQIVLKMVGRVLHGENEDVAANLRLAHDWVVQGFVGLTRDDVRKQRWGQAT